MPHIDARSGEVVIRIVYDGAPEAGKTTNVAKLGTLMSLQRVGAAKKPGTTGDRTEFFDWLDFAGGYLDGRRVRCQLVSVPGQSRLLHRRRYLLEKADAIVFVADSRQNTFADAIDNFATTTRMVTQLAGPVPVGVILQANKQDLPGALTPADVAKQLGTSALTPVLGSIASRGDGVMQTFILAVRLATDRVRALLLGQEMADIEQESETPEALFAALLELEKTMVAEARAAERTSELDEPTIEIITIDAEPDEDDEPTNAPATVAGASPAGSIEIAARRAAEAPQHKDDGRGRARPPVPPPPPVPRPPTTRSAVKPRADADEPRLPPPPPLASYDHAAYVEATRLVGDRTRAGREAAVGRRHAARFENELEAAWDQVAPEPIDPAACTPVDREQTAPRFATREQAARAESTRVERERVADGECAAERSRMERDQAAERERAEAAREQTAREQSVREQREQAAHEQAAREQREHAAREQVAREQAAREQAAREQAAREQAAREQAARDQAAREQAAREQAAREQREQRAREQAAREQAAREQAAREQAAREQAAREQAAREQRERVEHEQAAGEQAAREQAAREQREQEAREQAAREHREQEARAQAAREQAVREQAVREQAAREETAREQAAREQREQEAREQAAREHREQEARAQAAREQAVREQAVREQAAREEAAREQAAREQREREAHEQAAREQAAHEQAAHEQAAREQAAREQAAREQAAREQAAREQAAREHAAREQAAREQAAREQREEAAREQAARDSATRPLSVRKNSLDPRAIPTLPNAAEIASGHVWPPVKGRASVAVATSGRVSIPDSVQPWAPADAFELHSDAGWILHSTPRWLYESESVARHRLLAYVRGQISRGGGIPEGRTLTVAKDGERWRLWLLTPSIQPLSQRVLAALDALDPTATSVSMREVLAAMRELRELGLGGKEIAGGISGLAVFERRLAVLPLDEGDGEPHLEPREPFAELTAVIDASVRANAGVRRWFEDEGRLAIQKASAP